LPMNVISPEKGLTRAIALRRPGDDMPGEHHLLEARQQGRHDFGIVVELQH
jgi:hypothetical protein